MAGFNQLLHVPGGILLQIIKPFCAIAGSGLNQTLKRPNETTIVDRIPIKNGNTRLWEFSFILINSK